MILIYLVIYFFNKLIHKIKFWVKKGHVEKEVKAPVWMGWDGMGWYAAMVIKSRKRMKIADLFYDLFLLGVSRRDDLIMK